MSNLYQGAPGFDRWMPYEVIKKAHVLYRAGMSAREISEKLYSQYGYKNAHSCECALLRAFRHHGFRLRTQSESRRALNVGKTCSGCDVPLDERTFGCQRCTTRHNDRKRRGMHHVSWARRCRRCGCSFEERTRGCGACTSRHQTRKLRGDETAVKSDFLNGCDRCGCPLDERTRGCSTCASRHYRRRKRGLVYMPAAGQLAVAREATPVKPTARRHRQVTTARSDRKKVAA